MRFVTSPADIVWTEIDNPAMPLAHFAFSPSLVGEEFTDAYSVQLARIGPGGRSDVHRDAHNHAFYFAHGEGTVQVGRVTHDIVPGTIVKIPRGVSHGLVNTGEQDLEFVVIYDPPHVVEG